MVFLEGLVHRLAEVAMVEQRQVQAKLPAKLKALVECLEQRREDLRPRLVEREFRDPPPPSPLESRTVVAIPVAKLQQAAQQLR